jgi:3-deoxy-manno-octulosonate cytidylyltransferase (CMP-KDO synthetase)
MTFDTNRKTGRAVGIIPARYGSSRLHAKPLIDLCGKPMLQHVYERARKASLLDRVVVATDHEQIAEAVRNFGGECIMTDSGIRSGSDRVACVAGKLTGADIIVNIQGDEPLISPEMIDGAVRPMLEDSSLQVVTPVRVITSTEELQYPGTVKVVLDRDGYALYFSRSVIPFARDGNAGDNGQLPVTYYKHIGLYVFAREVLMQFSSWQESILERVEKLEQLRLLENGCRIKTVVTSFDSMPVDTAEDADRVRAIMRQTGESAA